MSDQTTYITQEGLEKLRAELVDLKKVQRPEMINRLEAAKALGDLSENAEYHEAKDTLSFIEGHIREIEMKLNDYQIIEDSAHAGGRIGIGSTIVVEFKDKEKTYQIVGSSEADPAGGRISNESPLGSAFLGRKKGDVVSVQTPAGNVNYTILEVK